MMVLEYILNLMLSGEGIVFLLFFWICLETVILLLKNKDFLLGKFGKEERRTEKEVTEYSSKAINLATITFAVISLTIVAIGKCPIESTFDISHTLFVFVLGLAFFIISYKISVFSATRRVYWYLQEKFLNFGILALVFGLFLFFKNNLPQYSGLMFLTIIFIVIIHIKEFREEYNYFSKMKVRYKPV